MAKKVTNGLDLQAQRIQNMGDGSAPGDAVTKAQLDAIARGLDWKNSVKVATTANIALSGTQTIDGVAVAGGDRVLVKNQTTQSENGIYVVVGGGAWTRATDFDDNVEITSAAVVSVEQGTSNGDAAFILTTDGAITVGTTALNFTRLGGTGISYTAGNGLQLSGSAFAVIAKANGGLIVDSSGVALDATQFPTLGLTRKVSGNVSSGSTNPVITHNLNTLDVQVTLIEVSTGQEVDCDVVASGVNQVTLGFAVAPSANQYRYIIIG